MQSQKDFRHSPTIDKKVDVIQNCVGTSNYYCSNKDEYTLLSFSFFGERQHDKVDYAMHAHVSIHIISFRIKCFLNSTTLSLIIFLFKKK